MSHHSADADWRRSNRRSFGYCLVVALGAILFGLDQAAIGGLLAVPEFQKDFGSFDPVTQTWSISAAHQTLLFGVLLLGADIASILSGPIGTRLGRKAGLYCCAIVSLIGPIIQINAPGMAVMAFGRAVTGAGIGFAANFCVTYWTEVAPAKYRGMIVMMYQGFINVAAFIGAGINQGTYNLDSDMAWRWPLIIMMTAPLVLLVLTPFIPETPRYFVVKNRPTDARKSLSRLRGPTWPPEELEETIHSIETMIEIEKQVEGATSYMDCLRGTDLRRTRIVFLLITAQAFTGISFITGYGTLFFQTAGVSKPFLITVITNICGLVGSIASFPLVRYFGRRTLLLIGGAICCVSMLIFAIVGVVDPQGTAASSCLVAFTCIYLFSYGATWGPVPLAVVGEVPTNSLRSKTLSLTTAINWGSTALIGCGSPYLLNAQYANLGTKMGFIFGGCIALSIVWVYFDLPETKDRTLEEIDEMFLQRIPTRKFKEYVCTGEARDLHVTRAGGEKVLTIHSEVNV